MSRQRGRLGRFHIIREEEKAFRQGRMDLHGPFQQRVRQIAKVQSVKNVDQFPAIARQDRGAENAIVSRVVGNLRSINQSLGGCVPPRWLRSTKATFQPCAPMREPVESPLAPNRLRWCQLPLPDLRFIASWLSNASENGIVENLLASDPQIFGEGPLVIDPLSLPAKSGSLRDLD